MGRRSRRNHSPAFRAKVALAAFKGDKTLSELIAHFDVHPTQIEVYLKAYSTVSEARTSLGQYFEFYNRRRPHSSLDRMTPEQFYFTQRPQPKAA